MNEEKIQNEAAVGLGDSAYINSKFKKELGLHTTRRLPQDKSQPSVGKNLFFLCVLIFFFFRKLN